MTVDQIALLTARKEAVLTRLSELTLANGDGRNISVDGQSVDNTGKIASLYAELDKLNALISAAEGPWEIETEGR